MRLARTLLSGFDFVSPTNTLSQNGQCTPRPKNWSHDQSNFSSHSAMLRLDIVQMTRALTSVGSPLRSVETLWPCVGPSNFQRLTPNLQKVKKSPLARFQEGPWPPWRLIATHANSKIPVSHSQQKASHFLIATKTCFQQCAAGLRQAAVDGHYSPQGNAHDAKADSHYAIASGANERDNHFLLTPRIQGASERHGDNFRLTSTQSRRRIPDHR